MFNFLNGVFLAATLLSNIILYADEDFLFPAERDAVVAVSMHREFWRDDGNGKCKYTGLMVPYVRDWEEVVKHGEIETVLPPEPNKTAGHAFIINQKVCGDKVEPVFRAGVVMRATGGFLYKHSFAAYDVTEMKVEERPKWLEQVLHRIDRVAVQDPAAKAFVEFNKKASVPKMPDDLTALLQSLGQSAAPSAK
jgi:hypothetical protein